ncbi:MAG TPA: hypothetical protein VIV63_11720, partial [Steroidobacteraceae bacterium]
FHRPAVFGPAVGFFAFLANEARTSTDSGSADGLLWLPFILLVVTLIAAIPYILGAFLLLASCRVLPASWVGFMAIRLILGGVIGALIAVPFTHMLNWIPSSTADPRFNFESMLVGCVAGGVYCAAFLRIASPRTAGLSPEA